jgi:hypothetical protein
MGKTILIATLLAACATAQPNLSGVWELDKESTKGKAPDSFRMRIEQQGTSISIVTRVTNRGQMEQNFRKLVIGQETKGEMHGGQMTCQSEWDGATLLVHSVTPLGGKDLKLTDRYTLSADGNHLTFREWHQYGDETAGEDERVFVRKPTASWEPDASPKLAEEVYKNIQIMRGVPADRVMGVMMNLTKWLGVRCEHCHVGQGDAFQFEKDDKPPKQTARDMFLMIRKLNAESLPKGSQVTCWTCHRGEAKPQLLPPTK